jgi:iron complex transport system ATP-binding protein
MSQSPSQREGLVVSQLRVRHRHGPEVVCGVDLHARPGEVLGLLGPNGAGKSTLLKAMVGLLPATGSVHLDGQELSQLSPRDRARQVAYVPQRTALTAPLTVRSVVDLGRFAHREPWARPTANDRTAVERALADANVVELAERPFTTLSGGEQQRVLLARALATEAPVLLLDEPTSALDVRQVLLLHTILRTLANRGSIIVVVLHDLAEVRQHTDRAVLMREGKVHQAGATAAVVAPAPVRTVYEVELIEQGGLGYRLPTDDGGPT